MMFINYEKMLEHRKNTKRERNDVVSNDLLNRLVCAYFEYSLGRMTYVVGCCCDLIARNYDALTPAVRKFIVEEIDKLDTDEKIADTSVTRLGMDCDRDSWVALRDFLLNHMDDEHKSVRAIYADDTDFALSVASALRDGRLGAYCADVLSEEPPRPCHPLLSAPRAYLTPHIAWATLEARERLMQVVSANIAAFLAGKPQNVVSA